MDKDEKLLTDVEELENEEELEETEEIEEEDEDLPESEELDEELDEEGEEEEEKETVYSQEQVEGIVKRRVSTFNRKLDKMKPYETAVQKMSEITGLDIDTLISRLEGMSITEQAKILGMTPQQLSATRKVAEGQKIANAQTLKLQRELDEQKLISNPKYKDLPLYREEILEIMDDNPKLTMKQAYTLAKGDKATQAAVRDAEQRAVAKMTKSSNQKVVKPGSGTTKKSPKLDPTTIAAAKRVGMDPAEYAAYSNISSLDDYEKFQKSKKG